MEFCKLPSVVLMTDSNEDLANNVYAVLPFLGFIGFRAISEWGKGCFEHGKRNSNQQ